MKQKKTSNNSQQRWYETCGEAFFTQSILPFLANPSEELKSLAQTCKFIYQIYSQRCDEWWKNLLLKKYTDLHVDLLETSDMKGKLMMTYYQLLFYESHLDQVPEHLISCYGVDPKVLKSNSGYTDPRPFFMCASSCGYYYGQGFITMLISSFFSEEYDPCTIDTFRYSLEMGDSSKRMISMIPISLSEESSLMYEENVKVSDGTIFTIVISDDFIPSNFKSELEGFDNLYKALTKLQLLNRYIVSIGITYKNPNVNNSFKKIMEDELRKYFKETYYELKNYIIMECNVLNRDEVVRMARETTKRYRFIDTNLFLKHLMQSNKKKCSLM